MIDRPKEREPKKHKAFCHCGSDDLQIIVQYTGWVKVGCNKCGAFYTMTKEDAAKFEWYGHA